MHACNPSISKPKVEGSGVQSHLNGIVCSKPAWASTQNLFSKKERKRDRQSQRQTRQRVRDRGTAGRKEEVKEEGREEE